MTKDEAPVTGFMWSYLGLDGKERFAFSSFGETKTKAKRHFNFQNNSQRLEPIKKHKLYAVSMTFTETMEQQND